MTYRGFSADSGGTWWVNTQSGSAYLIDLDNMTHERAMSTHELRRDEEVVPLLAIEPVAVGQPMRMVIDVVGDGQTVTQRTTSPVTSIWEVID